MSLPEWQTMGEVSRYVVYSCPVSFLGYIIYIKLICRRKPKVYVMASSIDFEKIWESYQEVVKAKEGAGQLIRQAHL